MLPPSSSPHPRVDGHDATQPSSPGSGTTDVEPALDLSVPLFHQDSESLVLAEGSLEEVAELLQEFVHPHHTVEETLVGGVERGRKQDEVVVTRIPWWKAPSPWW